MKKIKITALFLALLISLSPAHAELFPHLKKICILDPACYHGPTISVPEMGEEENFIILKQDINNFRIYQSFYIKKGNVMDVNSFQSDMPGTSNYRAIQKNECFVRVYDSRYHETNTTISIPAGTKFKQRLMEDNHSGKIFLYSVEDRQLKIEFFCNVWGKFSFKKAASILGDFADTEINIDFGE